MKQTYDNYFKVYYEKNKDRILDKRRESSKEAAKKYYKENKLEILHKRKLKRQLITNNLTTINNKES